MIWLALAMAIIVIITGLVEVRVIIPKMISDDALGWPASPIRNSAQRHLRLGCGKAGAAMPRCNSIPGNAQLGVYLTRMRVGCLQTGAIAVSAMF